MSSARQPTDPEGSYKTLSDAMEGLTPKTIDQRMRYFAQRGPVMLNVTPSEAAIYIASNALKDWCCHGFQAKALSSSGLYPRHPFAVSANNEHCDTAQKHGSLPK